MPGLLRKNAKCPRCGDSLLMISNLTSFDPERVEREYYHEKRGPKVRRKRRCKFVFASFATADRERKRLEVTINEPLLPLRSRKAS